MNPNEVKTVLTAVSLAGLFVLLSPLSHAADGNALYRYPRVQYRWQGDRGLVRPGPGAEVLRRDLLACDPT